MRNVLFVCTANIDRSRTAEDIYKGVQGIEVRSAGTDESYADQPITKGLIDWADVIFCMENHHRSEVLRLSPKSGVKIRVLDIPDNFYRGEPELVKLITAKVSNFMSINLEKI